MSVVTLICHPSMADVCRPLAIQQRVEITPDPMCPPWSYRRRTVWQWLTRKPRMRDVNCYLAELDTWKP